VLITCWLVVAAVAVIIVHRSVVVEAVQADCVLRPT
jgi:hypothetical protein